MFEHKCYCELSEQECADKHHINIWTETCVKPCTSDGDGVGCYKKKCVLPAKDTTLPPPSLVPLGVARLSPQLSVSRTARGYRGPRLRAGGSLPCREA